MIRPNKYVFVFGAINDKKFFDTNTKKQQIGLDEIFQQNAINREYISMKDLELRKAEIEKGIRDKEIALVHVYFIGARLYNIPKDTIVSFKRTIGKLESFALMVWYNSVEEKAFHQNDTLTLDYAKYLNSPNEIQFSSDPEKDTVFRVSHLINVKMRPGLDANFHDPVSLFENLKSKVVYRKPESQ